MAIAIGDFCRAHYNSGIYIGEVIEDRGENYLVKVLAVLKHPMQGDLHHPGIVDGVFFHERKALAHYEKTNVKKAAVYEYEDDIPDYHASLQQAISEMRERLAMKDTLFNQLGLNKLEELQNNHYHKSYYR